MATQRSQCSRALLSLLCLATAVGCPNGRYDVVLNRLEPEGGPDGGTTRDLARPTLVVISERETPVATFAAGHGGAVPTQTLECEIDDAKSWHACTSPYLLGFVPVGYDGIIRIRAIDADDRHGPSIERRFRRGQMPRGFVTPFFSVTGIQSNGCILCESIAGAYLNTSPGIVRLLPDALTRETSYDVSFAVGDGIAVTGDAGTRLEVRTSGVAVSVAADGGILLGGLFASFDGQPAANLVKLRSDGSVDTSFPADAGAGFDDVVHDILTLPGGNHVIAGDFTTYSGMPVGRLARLNPDGSLDQAFTSSLGAGFDRTVSTIALQSDGSIIVGGEFTSYSGSSAPGLARLQAGGAADSQFHDNLVAQPPLTTAHATNVGDIMVLPDDILVVAAELTQADGSPLHRVMKIDSAGIIDQAFHGPQSPGPSRPVNAVAFQDGPSAPAGGAILAAGSFLTWNATSTPSSLVRLNLDGTLDPTFPGQISGPGNDGWQDIELLNDGRVVVAGEYAASQEGGIRLLEADGTLLAEAVHSVAAGDWTRSAIIYDVAVDAQGRFVMAGDFVGAGRQTPFGAWSCIGEYGHIDQPFLAASPVIRVEAIAVLADDRVMVAGDFAAGAAINFDGIGRLLADGGLDPDYSPLILTGTGANVSSLTLDADGGLLVGTTGTAVAFNDVPVGPLSRIQPSGQVDAAFAARVGAGPAGTFSVTAVPTGGALLWGRITTFNGAPVVAHLIRLQADGSQDFAFASNLGAGFDEAPDAVAVQADGRIVVVGDFLSLDGDTTAHSMVRLEADGRLDSAFPSDLVPPGSGGLRTVIVSRSGQIIVGGFFSEFNGRPSPASLVRLSPSGVVDAAFAAAMGDGFESYRESGTPSIWALHEFEDGRLLVEGNFIRFDERARPRLARLLPDGSLDDTFMGQWR